MRIYLDDARPCPVGWTLAKTADEAIALISKAKEEGTLEAVSLDHDLAPEHYEPSSGYSVAPAPPATKTGFDVALWIVENRAWPKLVVLHSMNPVGRERMFRLLTTAATREGKDVVVRQVVGFRRGHEDLVP
jgi:hypothetical protein